MRITIILAPLLFSVDDAAAAAAALNLLFDISLAFLGINGSYIKLKAQSFSTSLQTLKETSKTTITLIAAYF